MARKFLRYLIKLLFVCSLLLILYDYQRGFKLLSQLKKPRDLEEFRKTIIQISHTNLKTTQTISICPNTSIRQSTRYDYNTQKCRPRTITENDCDLAIRKYGKTPKDRECRKTDSNQIIKDLCKFTKASKRTSTSTKLSLVCNLQPCGGNPVRIGVIQPTFGLPVQTQYQYIAHTHQDIELILHRIIEGKGQTGFDYCSLYCKNKNVYIRQALVFPPMIKVRKSTDASNKKDLFNINIVVLDSVSRQHFYRQLPDTVETLRHVAETGNVDVLDYELFQSIAPRTFPNMRAMFSGIVDVDSDDEGHTYGLDSLFGKFNNLGYQTLLQEDSCWFDPWGAIITDNKHFMKQLLQPNHYKERWQNIQTKLRRLPIHNYGLTHLSCDAFLQYGKTNQFNDPPKVCFNGHLLPTYYLNYTYSILTNTENERNAFPAFLYTHLNAGHETSGKRIAYTDGILSEFLSKSSKLRNTLTIVMSDHGPKTTKYSQEFLPGRYEIGHALMFMIVPHKTQLQLRLNGMKALRTNQNRYVSHLDLFHTLMSIHDLKPSGLLQPISRDRDCNDVPIYSFMTCLCDGWEKHLPEQHASMHWIAEFAIGQLNNMITSSRQFGGYRQPLSQRQETLGSRFGYGRCERLVGKRFDKIRIKRNDNNVTIFTFDVVVEKYREEEIFEIVITKTHKNDIQLTKWRRVSIYQHYHKCRDNDVDVTLCICRKESSKDGNIARDLAKLLSIDFFQIKSQIKFYDSKCLALISRYKQTVFKSYELTNECADRTYNVTFALKNSNSHRQRLSDIVPKNFTIRPWSIHFVTSVDLTNDFHENDKPVDLTHDFNEKLFYENIDLAFTFVKFD